jgi:hypothetical protein
MYLRYQHEPEADVYHLLYIHTYMYIIIPNYAQNKITNYT